MYHSPPDRGRDPDCYSPNFGPVATPVDKQRCVPPRLPPRFWDPEETSIGLTGCGFDGIDGIDGMGMGVDQMDMDMMLGLGEGASGIDCPPSAPEQASHTWYPFDSFGSLGAIPPSSSDWAACLSWQCVDEFNPVESPAVSSSTSASGSTPIPISTAPPPPPPPPPPQPQHNCTHKTTEIIRRLYCANQSTPVSDGLPAPPMDLSSVLTRTGDVVGPLEQLLRCPCARLPHMAMLYASIVSRILLWYRQAAYDVRTAWVSSSSPPSPVRPTLAAQKMWPSLPGGATLKALGAEADGDNSCVSVPPVPVTVGTFQSDDRNVQSALASCLILSELRRVGGLIDAFISLGTGAFDMQNPVDACPDAGDPGAGGVDHSATSARRRRHENDLEGLTESQLVETDELADVLSRDDTAEARGTCVDHARAVQAGDVEGVDKPV
ncbi:hypothetical protein VSDG_05662 [Cytospora chrysosperma]|uniref:Aflatoxin regulatory protein domain-containing protein n=1 Tax=Cytospora chrysosperma TaxID=252740 RepID=A0A423VT20_CYTCH|nr:hypothetical protein VSDG_05662 [Valsa sordida]